MPKLLLTGAASWILGGKIHSGRATKALQKKHKKEQKNLYTQYYNDVYKLQEANAELQYTAEYLKKELESTVNKHEEETFFHWFLTIAEVGQLDHVRVYIRKLGTAAKAVA